MMPQSLLAESVITRKHALEAEGYTVDFDYKRGEHYVSIRKSSAILAASEGTLTANTAFMEAYQRFQARKDTPK